MSPASQIAANLTLIRENMAAAATRSGRSLADIRLVGITKYVEPGIARLLFEAGVTDLGESRPQELWRKATALNTLPIRWHFVGHLQRNKIEKTLPVASLIQSGDRLQLLEAINTAAASQQRIVDMLLEVHISADASKQGFAPEELPGLLPVLSQLPNLRIRGLMGMASLSGGSTQARRDFAALRMLRDELRKNAPRQIELTELSMGMSGDYQEAIEEGATIVRIGSALFEGLNVVES